MVLYFSEILRSLECFNEDSNTDENTTLVHTYNYLRLKKEVLLDKSSQLEGSLVNALFYLINECMYKCLAEKASAT